MRTLCAILAMPFFLACATGAGEFPRFEMQEIDAHAGDVCYAVTVADVNGDKRPDVIVATEDAVLWYENPGWRRQEIIRKATARDNVCIQPLDIDGDGQVDFALGAGWRPTDTKGPSTLQWLGRDLQSRWEMHPIRFEEPTLHRMRFGDVKGAGRKQLVVAPLQGRGTKGPNWGEGDGVRILVYDVPEHAASPDWPVEVADTTLHTVHNFQLVDLDGDRRDEIVAACWEGVFILRRDSAGHWTKSQIGSGNQESRPFRGASEVKVGRLGQNARYVATIEPWHGNQVVVYGPTAVGSELASSKPPALWPRQVVSQSVKWGHAVWCADLDDDGDDEIVIGQRDRNPMGSVDPHGPGVFVFDPRPGAGGLSFESHTLDDGGVACEDALAADLNGDGRLDIIAGGRATHNVRIYWNRKN
jgi:FG-GAP-like repeat